MEIVPIPMLADNYGYLVIAPQGREAAVIDPSEGAPVLAKVAELGVRLVAVLATHHHWDHTGGNEALFEKFPGLPVYGHRYDHERGRTPGLSRPVEEGDELEVGALRPGVLAVPGHTLGAVAYLFGDALFTGDTLFVAGCGRLFEGTPAQMHASLEKLARLPDETRIYCGHEYTEKNLLFARSVEPENEAIGEAIGEARALRAEGRPTIPSTIGREKEINPFLRVTTPAIVERLEGEGGGKPLDVVARFARLREMKDRF